MGALFYAHLGQEPRGQCLVVMSMFKIEYQRTPKHEAFCNSGNGRDESSMQSQAFDYVFCMLHAIVFM